MHQPPPGQRRRRPLILNLNLSREPELLAALRSRSQRTGAPVSELVRRAIRTYLSTTHFTDASNPNAATPTEIP